MSFHDDELPSPLSSPLPLSQETIIIESPVKSPRNTSSPMSDCNAELQSIPIEYGSELDRHDNPCNKSGPELDNESDTTSDGASEIVIKSSPFINRESESDIPVDSSPFKRKESCSESDNQIDSSSFGIGEDLFQPVQSVKRRCLVDDAYLSEDDQLTQQDHGDLMRKENEIQEFSSDESNVDDEGYLEHNMDFSSAEEDGNSVISLSINSSDSESSTISDTTSDFDIPERESLFDNARLTVDEAIVNLCDLYVKNRLTKTALADMIIYIRSILPEDNLMPKNLHEFFNFIKRASPPVKERAHMYCPICLTEKPGREGTCLNEGCGGEGANSFYEFPLADQIRFMFERRGLASLMDDFHKSRTPEEGFITDICDGSEIKKLRDNLSGPYDLALLWNVDGISLKDSEYHLWVCLFTFCQVPSRMRPYLVCLNSVWYDERAPDMTLFLKPFVDSLIEIEKAGGVQWTHPQTKQKILSKVAAPGASADAPARADLQGIKRFNSKNGCNICEITCDPLKVPLKTQDGTVRETTRYYYVYHEKDAKLRSGRRMSKQADLAKTHKDKSVLGVKGVSPAERIPHLDVGKFVFPEYMHSVLLGVVLSFTLMMMSFKSAWGLQKHIKDIDSRLLALKVPDFMKKPARLSKVGKYHAHELRAWLLYFSLPILSTYLPEKYLQHWILLVSAIYLLLKERISEIELQAADAMLRMFVREVESLYSKTAYKYNTHQLLHETLTVRRFGSLAENSTFMFENYNGVLTRMIHGTKHKGRELVENVKITTGMMALKCSVAKKDSNELCYSVLGREIEFCFDGRDLAAMAEVGCTVFKVFLRARVGKDVFTSQLYDSRVKRCNSFIMVSTDCKDEIAEIICFVKNCVSDAIWCWVDFYSVDHTRYFVHNSTRFQVEHIIPIKKPKERCFIPVAKVRNKLIRVENFVCKMPNTIEINL